MIRECQTPWAKFLRHFWQRNLCHRIRPPLAGQTERDGKTKGGRRHGRRTTPGRRAHRAAAAGKRADRRYGHGLAHQGPPRHPLPDGGGAGGGPCGSAAGPEDDEVRARHPAAGGRAGRPRRGGAARAAQHRGRRCGGRTGSGRAHCQHLQTQRRGRAGGRALHRHPTGGQCQAKFHRAHRHHDHPPGAALGDDLRHPADHAVV